MTIATLTANAAYAFDRASAGHPVVPLCWPGENAACTFPVCPGKWDAPSKRHVAHDARDVGKAPLGKLVPEGWRSASADVETVAEWWARYPDANVGEPLEPNGWLVVDPDNAHAQAEAHKLGLSPTLTRHSKNTAFVYTRPSDCPPVNLTKRGDSGQLDILATGYVVTFGTHREGHQVRLDDSAITSAPAWAVAWLTQEAGKRESAKQRSAERTAGGDESPVRLHSRGLQRWRGELVQTTDGRTDTSESLFYIGLDLAECNASHSAIVAALAARDVALGWRKYTDRPDAADRYGEIADKAVAREDARRQGGTADVLTWPTLGVGPAEAGPANGSCSPHCARHVEELRRWRGETAALFRNPDLSAAEKLAHWALVNEFTWNGEPHKVRIKEFARRTGSSDRAVGRAIDRLSNPDDSGAPFRKTVTRERLETPLVNPKTGELVEWVSCIELAPKPKAAPDLLRAGATFSPKDRPEWGGAGRQRKACTKHPEAAVLATTALECSVCHEPIGAPETVVRKPQDALNVQLVRSDAQRPQRPLCVGRTPDVQDVHSDTQPPTPETDYGFDPPSDGTRTPWRLSFLTLGSAAQWRSHTLCGVRVRQGQKYWEVFAAEHADKLPRVVEELRQLREAAAGVQL